MDTRQRMRERGAVMTIVVGVALVASVLAYGILYLAVANASRNQFYTDRGPARYFAEAGAVWAMQQLWVDPAWNAPGGVDISAQVGAPAGTTVSVSYPVCGVPPCPLQVTVIN